MRKNDSRCPRLALLCTGAFIALVLPCRAATVEGILNGAKANQEIYLQLLLPQQIIPVDTATVDSKGHFHLHSNRNDVAFYRLFINANNWLNIILSPKDKLFINTSASTLKAISDLGGSKQTEALHELDLKLTALYTRRDSINKAITDARVAGHGNEANTLVTASNQIVEEARNYIRSFIVQHQSELVGLAGIEQLNAQTDLKYYKMLDEGLMKTIPESPYAKTFHQRISELSFLAVGTEAPDLELPTPEGKMLRLSSLRGQVVLLDFWASWCGPCRRENPNVVKAYQKYHDKGFTVYSISLDKSAQSWKAAIEHDKLVWPNHVSDLKYWKSTAAKTYKISSIPHAILIDPEGKIIMNNVRGLVLEQKLAEIFGD